MPIKPSAGLALALLAGGAMAAAPAQAQQLFLGPSDNPTLSGTATITKTGTSASGTYSYNDGGTGIALANQPTYYECIAYGSSTANISGGYVDFLYAYDTSTTNVTGGNGTGESVGLRDCIKSVSGD